MHTFAVLCGLCGETDLLIMNEQEYITSMLNRSALFFTQAELDKVRNSTFAIAGLGGVGAITAELLARWGVKKFRLLDMDQYEPSNLNRQLFATSQTLGQYKVEVTSDRIKEINPYTEIETIVRDRVDNDNVHKFVKHADIVIQTTDSPSSKLFYLSAEKHRIPLVNGYSTITGCRIQTFDYRNSKCTSFLDSMWRRLKFRKQKSLDKMNREELDSFDAQFVHATAPSLNFVTNMVGCLIIAETIKLITGRGKVILYPQYLEFDIFDFKMNIRHSNSVFDLKNIKKLFAIVINRL
ncbi:MAG: ThiF family adenylyltransferase [Desulfobacterales bacterium]|nr:ThiF family adenylyltransferase [Desulfobacterales bacterium]